MRLTVTSNGVSLAFSADDADVTLVEARSGSEDFVMVRLKPGALRAEDAPDGDRSWRA